MKTKTIGYWVSTAIIAFVLLSGGVVDVLHPKAVVEGMAHLGYPVYFMIILGTWKVLGGIVLIAPRLPRLKEWAYAGAIFDFTGATASHAFSGDNAVHIATPLLFAFVALLSWALRSPSRKLGTILPVKSDALPKSGVQV